MAADDGAALEQEPKKQRESESPVNQAETGIKTNMVLFEVKRTSKPCPLSSGRWVDHHAVCGPPSRITPLPSPLSRMVSAAWSKFEVKAWSGSEGGNQPPGDGVIAENSPGVKKRVSFPSRLTTKGWSNKRSQRSEEAHLIKNQITVHRLLRDPLVILLGTLPYYLATSTSFNNHPRNTHFGNPRMNPCGRHSSFRAPSV